MVGSLIVITLSGAVALAIGNGGVRKQPDGSPTARTPVNTRRLAAYAVPGAIMVLLLLIFAQSNWDRYTVLAMTTIVVVFFAASVQLRR